MRAALVVARDVLAKNHLEVTPGEHEYVIEAIFADGAHPAFGERIRSWRAHRGEDRLGADRGEDVVEGRGELGVAVADEEPHRPSRVFEVGT